MTDHARSSVRIGDYRLWYDGRSWCLGEIRVRQSGKNVGMEYETNVRSHGTLESALLRLQDVYLGESGSESLEELAAALLEFRGRLAGLFALTWKDEVTQKEEP